MSKALGAFFLGILFFPVFMFVAETADYRLGDIAAFIVTFFLLAAYFFICQFFLSQGHSDAYRKDWPIMLALDAAALLSVLVIVLAERREVFLTQGLGILVFGCGGTFAGAVAASLVARKRGGKR